MSALYGAAGVGINSVGAVGVVGAGIALDVGSDSVAVVGAVFIGGVAVGDGIDVVGQRWCCWREYWWFWRCCCWYWP